ncbi:hypothetical protein GC176_20575 [bacterium]|nr:hypothetical protein [bacterium]
MVALGLAAVIVLAGLVCIALGVSSETFARFGNSELKTSSIGTVLTIAGLLLAGSLAALALKLSGKGRDTEVAKALETEGNENGPEPPTGSVLVGDQHDDQLLTEIIETSERRVFLVILIEVTESVIQSIRSKGREFGDETDAKRYHAKYLQGLSDLHVELEVLVNRNWFRDAAARYGREVKELYSAVERAFGTVNERRNQLRNLSTSKAADADFGDLFKRTSTSLLADVDSLKGVRDKAKQCLDDCFRQQARHKNGTLVHSLDSV